MQKIKRGDKVLVLVGKDKGREGEVLRVVYSYDVMAGCKRASHIIVEGIGMIKKHIKGNPSKEKQGGIIEKESFLDYSNVAIVNPSTGKKDKIGFKYLDNGKKIRFFKLNKEVVDV